MPLPQLNNTHKSSPSYSEETRKKGEEIKILSNKVSELSSQLKICRYRSAEKQKKTKLFNHQDWNTDKPVKQFTGIPTRATFDFLFSFVKGQVGKVILEWAI